MKLTKTITAFSLALLAVRTSSVSAADTAPANADKILQAMSAKLAAAKQFSYHAQREIDPALLEGRDLAAKASVDVSVSRPNQFAARSVSKEHVRRFIADGRNLTLSDEAKNVYAQVPMRTSLDGLVAQLDEKYGFTPPLAEFAVSNPYKDFRKEARSVSYAGLEMVGAGFLGLGGVECHHLALKGPEADAELWVAVGDQLPRKLVATFKRPGHPQLRINFSSWNLAVPVPAAEFTFTPPAGAEKIEMWSKARMQAASKH